MSDITITLTLTEDELTTLQALTLMDAVKTGGTGDLNNKVARAIERAESFVDDEYETVETINGHSVQDRAGCDGVGMSKECEACSGSGVERDYKSAVGEVTLWNCVDCNGTGKEYV